MALIVEDALQKGNDFLIWEVFLLKIKLVGNPCSSWSIKVIESIAVILNNGKYYVTDKKTTKEIGCVYDWCALLDTNIVRGVVRHLP